VAPVVLLKPVDKSSTRKGPDYDYDRRNISEIIFGTDIPQRIMLANVILWK